MKRLRSIFKSLPVVFTALLSSFLYSCQDDSLLPNGDAGRPEEGLPATVSLKVCLPDMDVKTRANGTDENYVGTLWVGVFNDDTDGTLLTQHTYNPPSETASDEGSFFEVDSSTGVIDNLQLSTVSGRVRIVAIANAEEYMGIDPEQKSSTGMVRKTALNTLLESTNMKSLKQLRGIRIMRNSTTDITNSQNTLLMSGYYDPEDYSSNANVPTSFYTGDELPTVDIYPNGSSTPQLSGAIYLRRLISYNKFNISAGANVNLTLNTWRVMNIPYCSYILEEKSNACTSVQNGNNPGLESHLFNTDDDSDVKSFEFYQLENKHDALSYKDLGNGDYLGIDPSASDPYDCREREWKNDDGSNSGAYKSLVNMNLPSLPDNMASYVVITATLDYYYNARYKDNPDEAVPEAEGASANQIHRKADVTYTIHLGYCEGKNLAAKATDFNCRRNTKYTYNVKINGVNKLVVEAKKEEQQPGSEGTVLDMTADPVILDAHYNVFNIQLTDEERENLRWYIYTPYAGRPYIYESEDDGTKEFDTNSECYTWIKFRPTSGEKVLAKYRDKYNDLTLENLMSLDDLKDVAGHPNTLDTGDDPMGKWYTVFIDEYVYHSDPKGGNKETGDEVLWGNYVNQDNRSVDLYNEKMFLSKDNESSYIPAIYSFSQRSIQTHYKETAQDESAFGVEHINENYGLNFKENNSDNSNKYNGRLIQNRYVRQLWSNWVQFTVPDDVPEANNTEWNFINIPAKSYPVPLLKPMNYTPPSDYRKFYPNPSSSNFYSTGGSCLNRNRDLDGNDSIDQRELRWYVPASEEYIQMSIGQTELPSPLIKFIEHSRTEFRDVTGYNAVSNTATRWEQQYHYMTSDDRYFWAEQGMSVGEHLNWYDASHTYCYQVRCIRQLGKNPANEPNSDKTNFDFASSFNMEHTSDDRYFIESTYFTDNSVRPSTSGFVPPHDVGSVNSLPSSKFEVARDVCRNMTSKENFFDVNENGYMRQHGSQTEMTTGQTAEARWNQSCSTNSLCSLYTQESDGSDLGTWRVPNIRELAMMRTVGLAGPTQSDLDNNSTYTGYYLSCSYEYFEYPGWTSGFRYRFYGKRGDDSSIARNMMTDAQNGYQKFIHVKCVRDVITNDEFEWKEK